MLCDGTTLARLLLGELLSGRLPLGIATAASILAVLPLPFPDPPAAPLIAGGCLPPVPLPEADGAPGVGGPFDCLAASLWPLTLPVGDEKWRGAVPGGPEEEGPPFPALGEARTSALRGDAPLESGREETSAQLWLPKPTMLPVRLAARLIPASCKEVAEGGPH